MQKAILYIIIGALIASGVWGYAYYRADVSAANALEQVRGERDAAITRAASLESELESSLSTVRGLTESIRNLKAIIDEISDGVSSLDAGIGEYGAINRDFGKFISRYGAEK